MKLTYNKTNWVDNSTPVNAENLNNIENGISNLYSSAISLSDLVNGDGIDIKDTNSGISIGLNFKEADVKPESSISSGSIGDFYIEDDNFFFCIGPNRWIKLKLENF